MGLLDGILGSGLTGLAGIGQQIAQNDYNRKEAEKNREFQSAEAEVNRIFQSNEAALQRDWSAAEAERARDWQEEMYERYNSLSGKIAQAEKAGVNPLFAVTGGAVSPGSFSSSAPGGASAGSVGTPSGSQAASSFVDIVGQVLGFQKLKSQINVDNALAEKYRSEAEGQNITNEQLHDMNAAEIMSHLSDVQLNDANIELIASKVLNTNADTEVKGSQLGLIVSQIKNTDADTLVKQKQLDVLASEIVKNNKSVDVMSAQISLMASEAGLNREKAKEIAQNVRNLVQQYGHNSVMNTLDEMVRSADATDANFRNPANYFGVNRAVRQFLNELYGLINVVF